MSGIQVGEYVRYKSGLIRKVTSIKPIYMNGLLLSNSYYIEFDNLGNLATYKNDYVEEVIKKHSKNIIDLIEARDFVDGYKVEEFDDEEGNAYLGIPIYDDAIMDCIVEVLPIDEMEIKKILTHEMYENNCYKVVE